MLTPKEFLITGFTEYCGHVLRQVADILGVQPLFKILEDINNVLGYVKKYQSGSREKSKIVNDMRITLVKFQNEYKLDKKNGGKGGIFSFFS